MTGAGTTANGKTTTLLKTEVRTDLGTTDPNAMTWRKTWRFSDGLGRTVQKYADAVGGVDVVNSTSNILGLKTKDTVPHRSTNPTGSFFEADWLDGTIQATTSSYDGRRRLRITTLPGPAGNQPQVKQNYDDEDGLWGHSTVDQNGHARKLCRDGLGRVVRVREYTGSDPNFTLYATTTYGYNVADQLTSVSDHLNNPTTITYDKTGRNQTMADPDLGAWSYEYDPVGTLKAQTDARGQRTELGYDKLKRLVRKWYAAAWTQETITAGSSKPGVYDLMELRSAVDTNRAAIGLSTGGWTNDEIVAGKDVPIRAVHFTELRSRIQDLWTQAGMGTIPEFTGGAIVAGSRVIKASDPTDLRSWLVQYENSAFGQSKRARVFIQYDWYDGVTQFGRGKRTALWDGSGRSSWDYDQAGRLRVDRRIVDGRLYTTEWTYDALDRVYTLKYPDLEVLTHSYLANGLLGQITSSLNAPTNLVASAEYNALGLPTHYQVGGVGDVYRTYWGVDTAGSPYGAVRTIQLVKSPNPAVVDRTLTYDPVGNITQIADAVTPETITYGYDALDRLLSASAPSGESFGYNEIGNITSKNGTGYGYDATHKHALTTVGGVTRFGYDANGNMTTRDSQSIKYDPENRPVRVNTGGSTICRFAYDGDGTRRKRLDSAGTVHYVGPYERNVGNGANTTEVITKYYYVSLGSVRRLIAFRRAGTFYLVGTDHLGSSIRVLDQNMNALDQMRYYAFGSSRDAGSNLVTDHRFTEQIEDAAIGLYWYNSRAYDPAIGRFVAPDTIVPEPKNPQALNRYSYAHSNPLKSIDPSGHFPVPLVPILALTVAGTVSGALAGATSNLAGQLAGGKTLDKVDWGSAGTSAAEGAAGGFVVGLGVGVFGVMTAMAVAGSVTVTATVAMQSAVTGIATAVGYALSDAVANKPADPLTYLVAGATAAVTPAPLRYGAAMAATRWTWNTTKIAVDSGFQSYAGSVVGSGFAYAKERAMAQISGEPTAVGSLNAGPVQTEVEPRPSGAVSGEPDPIDYTLIAQ